MWRTALKLSGGVRAICTEMGKGNEAACIAFVMVVLPQPSKASTAMTQGGGLLGMRLQLFNGGQLLEELVKEGELIGVMVSVSVQQRAGGAKGERGIEQCVEEG